jgi:hypothetical protein
MAESSEKNFETKKIAGVSRNVVEVVVVEYVVVGSQTAVHGPFSELRNPAAVGTWWVGLASTQCLRPSQDEWVQGSRGVGQEMGAVKW